MWAHKILGKRYPIIKLTVCCFTLATTSESLAVEEIIFDRHKATGVESEEMPGELAPTEKPFELFLSAGYRKDNLNWNEAGGSVNILSELKWENLKIAQISAAARLNFHTSWSLRGMIASGSVMSGSNQDSDYNGNNRTLEFSRSNNKGGGKVRDGSIGLGRTLRLSNRVGEYDLSIFPQVGLSIHQQNLTMTNGFQTLPATGSYPGLNSSYQALWQGPWVGIDVQLKNYRNWSLAAAAEYHWADYSANADWNLRPEFSHPVSFVHTARGRGITLSAEATYLVSNYWRGFFSLASQQWKTGAGIDKTFFSDGSVGYNPLNGVNWGSTAINLGLARIF